MAYHSLPESALEPLAKRMKPEVSDDPCAAGAADHTDQPLAVQAQQHDDGRSGVTLTAILDECTALWKNWCSQGHPLVLLRQDLADKNYRKEVCKSLLQKMAAVHPEMGKARPQLTEEPPRPTTSHATFIMSERHHAATM